MSSDDLSFDFSSEVGKASWELLQPHFKRDALFIVDPKLEMATVAKSIAKDEVNLIKIWIDNGDLRRPTLEEDEQWSKEIKKDIANFLIIQPYVIMQLL